MNARSYWIFACLAVSASPLLSPAIARADFGRHCESRPLDPAERDAVGRIVSELRTALPPAPARWTVSGEDVQGSTSGSACREEGKNALVPQPIVVTVHRAYLRTGEPPRAAAAPSSSEEPGVASAPAPADRIKQLEVQLAELQASDKEAVAAYQEARRKGDKAAQAAARQRDQDLRLAMRPVQQELSTLRSGQRHARAADAEARTTAAQARAREAEANRRDASVSLSTNLRQVDAGGDAEILDVPGTAVALRHRSGRVHLLLGSWRYTRESGWAVAKLDETAPPPRIQTIAVQIDGNAATVDALRGKVAVTALQALVAR